MLVDIMEHLQDARANRDDLKTLNVIFLKSSFVFKTIETVLFVFANVKIET